MKELRYIEPMTTTARSWFDSTVARGLQPTRKNTHHRSGAVHP